MNCPLRIFWSISPGLSYWCMSKGKHTYKLSMDLLVYFHKVSIVFEHLSKAYLRSPASASDLGLMMISAWASAEIKKFSWHWLLHFCVDLSLCVVTHKTHTPFQRFAITLNVPAGGNHSQASPRSVPWKHFADKDETSLYLGCPLESACAKRLERRILIRFLV